MEKLLPIKDLFKKSFEIYRKNFWTFIQLTVVEVLPFLILVPIGIAFFLTRNDIYIPIILFFVAIIFFLVVAVIAFWVKVSLLYVMKEDHLTAKQYLLKSWVMLGSYSWVYALLALVILGGFILLIIPGIIFAVWFSFSTYVLIFEDKKGTLALKRSKQLVQGNWWGIFGRFLIIGVLASIISWIPFLGSLVNIFFTMPFWIVYSYVMYEDLKRIKDLV